MKRYVYATDKTGNNGNDKATISSVLNEVFRQYADAALNRTNVSKKEVYPVSSKGYKVSVEYNYSYSKNILQAEYRVQVIHPKGGVVEEHNFKDSDSFAACMSDIAQDYA